MKTNRALESRRGEGSCQGCGRDRRGASHRGLGGNPSNFPPQLQLFQPPRISYETKAAEPPSEWGSTLPLVVESKGTSPPPFFLFLFFRLVQGGLSTGAAIIPSLSCAPKRVGDAFAASALSPVGGWDAAAGDRGGGVWEQGGIPGIQCWCSECV